MKAYVIAQVRVSDAEPYNRYAAVRSDSAAWYGAGVVGRAPATGALQGPLEGRPVVRRGSLILLEGLE